MRGKKKFKMRHLLLLLFVAYILSTLVMQQFKMISLAKEEKQLKARIEEAMNQKTQLQNEINLLQTNDYIEKVARDELGLVKPGEYIFKGVKTLK